MKDSITAGTFHIDGGFRPCIAKAGYKWSYLLYVVGGKIKCKKLKTQKTGKMKPVMGQMPYDVKTLAHAFLKKNALTGRDREMNQKARAILLEAVSVNKETEHGSNTEHNRQDY